MDPVVIVGGGMAGLACATTLEATGTRVLLLEANDVVGGRVGSAEVEGFVLDRGFQVYLDAYPAAGALLDLPALNLHRFVAGAVVHHRDGPRRILDPVRHPTSALSTLRGGTFTLADAWRIALLRATGSRVQRDARKQGRSATTAQFLSERGFSRGAVEGFFRPFFSGVFMEDELVTPLEMFAFAFRMFAHGNAALPAGGMRRIPDQLAARLPEGSIRTRVQVGRVDGQGVTLHDGTRIPARAVVLAANAANAATLLGVTPGHRSDRHSTTMHYAAAAPPFGDPILHLGGPGPGRIHSVVVPSGIAPGYAPAGQHLVSVTTLDLPDLDDDALDGEFRRQLVGWYGDAATGWRRLQVDRIPQALPIRFGQDAHRDIRLAARALGVTLAGDYLDNPSIEGAVRTGIDAAQAVQRGHAGG